MCSLSKCTVKQALRIKVLEGTVKYLWHLRLKGNHLFNFISFFSFKTTKRPLKKPSYFIIEWSVKKTKSIFLMKALTFDWTLNIYFFLISLRSLTLLPAARLILHMGTGWTEHLPWGRSSPVPRAPERHLPRLTLAVPPLGRPRNLHR